jgi:hypothetical protein
MTSHRRRRSVSHVAPVTLGPAIARRLDNQIRRTLLRTYGAQAGLRVLVRLGTRQMLLDGASREAIGEALTARVLDQSSRVLVPQPVVTGESESEAITKLMLRWAEEVDLNSSNEPSDA